MQSGSSTLLARLDLLQQLQTGTHSRLAELETTVATLRSDNERLSRFNASFLKTFSRAEDIILDLAGRSNVLNKGQGSHSCELGKLRDRVDELDAPFKDQMDVLEMPKKVPSYQISQPVEGGRFVDLDDPLGLRNHGREHQLSHIKVVVLEYPQLTFPLALR